MSAPTHWFEALADHMGEAYLRYSFTRGTAREVAHLIEVLQLGPGHRVLDIGCGPGRHALALAEHGIEVVGVDISARFVAIGNEAAQRGGLADHCRFVQADGRSLWPMASPDPSTPIKTTADSAQGSVDQTARMHEAGLRPGSFDAVISLCQGAFGLAGGQDAIDELPRRELDEPILATMAAALRPNGRVAVSAFSAYFQIRHLEHGDEFDAWRGVNHERTEIRNPAGEIAEVDLWTTCFTPRELRMMARLVGLDPIDIYGVTPGDYGYGPPSLDRPEFLLIAQRRHLRKNPPVAQNSF